METLILVEKYFLLFIIYSLGGWIIEEIYCSISEKKIVNRGFLIGPICPIYGFGGLLITLLLTRFAFNPLLLFLMCMISCAVLEYLASLIMEKVFNARWWDYSDQKFNINGRICLKNLVPFGLFGLLVIYIVNPFIFEQLDKLSLLALEIMSLSIAAVTIIDLMVSIFVISKVTDTAEKISNENPRDNTNEINKRVRNELKESFTSSRFLDAFPNYHSLKTRIVEVAENTAKKGKETAKKSKEAIKKTAQKGKEKIKNKKKEKKK